MATLFRSKSSNLASIRNPQIINNTNMFNSECHQAPNNQSSMFFPKFYDTIYDDDEEDDIDEYDDEEDWENPISTPFVRIDEQNHHQGHSQFSVMAILVTALRKSIVTCSVETDDVSSMDISGPTEVRHISHVTFDRFNGFLGLPVEFEPELPKRVPSASASVFGVSAKSMQCSYDERGNSVPTILLMMQKRLYSEGGLQAEGIFRINPENSQEEFVRNQLNRGLVPRGLDIHCLAGLIKAWLRELPTGVLDSLTPQQVMHCNSEDEYTQLVQLLPPTEAAILDWAINLMADVVEHEQENKMNARNIAMVFAPNMTQMSDPLTALIHAVQVMNFLKTLILTTLRERQESVTCADSSCKIAEPNPSNSNNTESFGRIMGTSRNKSIPINEPIPTASLLRTSTLHRLESESKEEFWSFDKKKNEEEENQMGDMEKGEGILERLNLRRGVRKLCNHPVFQLSKPMKKGTQIGIVNS